MIKRAYYLRHQLLEEKKYYLHSADCPLLPSHEKSIYLGKFLSADEAAAAALKYYGAFTFCRFCQADALKVNAGRSANDNTDETEFISTDEVKEGWDIIALGCLN